jgi:hypothetical protein
MGMRAVALQAPVGGEVLATLCAHELWHNSNADCRRQLPGDRLRSDGRQHMPGGIFRSGMDDARHAALPGCKSGGQGCDRTRSRGRAGGNGHASCGGMLGDLASQIPGRDPSGGEGANLRNAFSASRKRRRVREFAKPLPEHRVHEPHVLEQNLPPPRPGPRLCECLDRGCAFDGDAGRESQASGGNVGLDGRLAGDAKGFDRRRPPRTLRWRGIVAGNPAQRSHVLALYLAKLGRGERQPGAGPVEEPGDDACLSDVGTISNGNASGGEDPPHEGPEAAAALPHL